MSIPFPPPLLGPIEQPQEVIHVVQQLEELVESRIGIRVLRNQVWAATTLAARFEV